MTNLDSGLESIQGIVFFILFIAVIVFMVKTTLIMKRLKKENLKLYEDLGRPSIWRSNSILVLKSLKKMRDLSEIGMCSDGISKNASRIVFLNRLINCMTIMFIGLMIVRIAI